VKHTSTSITTDAETSVGVRERRVLSQRELAKENRRVAYQGAKERRATDPRYLAMKEAARMQRRAAYQKAKERRKALTADDKAKRKAGHTEQCISRRGEADRALMRLVTWVLDGSTAQND
jgi:hypothetical protein